MQRGSGSELKASFTVSILIVFILYSYFSSLLDNLCLGGFASPRDGNAGVLRSPDVSGKGFRRVSSAEMFEGDGRWQVAAQGVQIQRKGLELPSTSSGEDDDD